MTHDCDMMVNCTNYVYYNYYQPQPPTIIQTSIPVALIKGNDATLIHKVHHYMYASEHKK